LGLVAIVTTRAAIAAWPAITAGATLATETAAAALAARSALFARWCSSGSRWWGNGCWRGALGRGSWFSAHAILELETTFASGVSEDFHFTLIGSATAIEDDRGDTDSFRLEGKRGPEQLCSGYVGLQFLFPQSCIEAAKEN